MSILNEVRAKVIEAVPGAYDCGSPCRCPGLGPVTLADVLRAIPLMPEASFNSTLIELLRVWNLALSLDEQEPGVIEFLHKILV